MDWRKALSPFVREQVLDLYVSDRPRRKVLLDCALGTNPLGMSPVVRRVLEGGGYQPDLSRYPVDQAPFLGAISDFWKGRVLPEEVLPGAGTMEILFNLIRLFGNSHATLLGLSPQFPDVPQRFRLYGARYQTVKLPGPDYRLDVRALTRAITEEVSLVYVDQPHNPTGQAWSLSDLGEIAARCSEVGALLVVDEAYGAALPEEQSAVMLTGQALVVLRSFSKIWGLAGLRAGYAVSRCPDFRTFYRKCALPMQPGRLALDLVPAALSDRGFLERSRATFRKVKDQVLALVRSTPGMSVAATAPTTPIFYVEPHDPQRDLFGELLGGGILTERGSCYQGVKPGGVRIRIPSPAEVNLFLELWSGIFRPSSAASR